MFSWNKYDYKHAPLYKQNEFFTCDDFFIERVVSGFMKIQNDAICSDTNKLKHGPKSTPPD